MTVLMSVSAGGPLNEIEMVLTRHGDGPIIGRSVDPKIIGDDTGDCAGRYTVAVNDSEGLLHLTEFRYNSPQELLDACEDALAWFENIREVVDEYVRHPTSQQIRSLINTLN